MVDQARVEPISRSRPRLGLPRLMLLVAAILTAVAGFVHLRDWLDTYRDVPASAPGSWLVRAGFPVHGVVAMLLAAALVFAAVRLGGLVVPVVAATAVFHGASLALVIATRTGTVLGWSEPVWTRGAEQSRAVAIAALFVLGAAGAVWTTTRRAAGT